LARSALNALKRLVHDPTLTGRSVSDGEPGHPAGFLIGYCVEESLIAGAASGYALNRGKFAAWLCKSMKERFSRLAEYAGEFLGGMGLELAQELLSRGEGRWIAVNQIIPEAERPAFARALDVFEFLGHAHTCRPHGGARFSPYKRAKGDADAILAGEPVRETVIMPDFSVVIPQEVSPEELFGFSKIGILDAFDKVYRGEITKESVSNALSAGVDAEYLRGWLRDRRAAANVVKTVDEWMREFNRLYVSSLSALISCDEKVTRQIAALEPLRKHLTQISAHTVFAIKRGSEGKVLDILEKLGFDTRAPGEQAEGAKYDEKPAADTPQKSAKRRITPLTGFNNAAPDPAPPDMRRTKYGSGLKELDISEMIHVVDYAMLTNQALVIDYDGSAYIKQSIYTVVPVGIDKGVDAAVEAEIPCVRGRKQFYLNKIKRIGVVAQ
ncbi:MAG: helicase-associated domain-containing protein, partial [Chitinispirillales bacterium]|nr:helicase-associated domain-containing protein [Chitinispirillales bacterium]